MTRIAADQLISTLGQEVTIYRDTFLAGIRAKLYIHNMPDGKFYFNFYNKYSEKIYSYQFDSFKAKEAIDTPYSYFWVDLALAGNLNLEAGEYYIALESWNYSFNEKSFLGWVKDFDLYGDVLGEPKDFSEYPFSFKLIEYADREVAI